LIGKPKSLKEGNEQTMTGVWEIVNIQKCREAGLSKTATAQRLALDRGTVAKYWDVVDALKEAPTYQRTSKIEPYKEYITERLEKWPELSAERIFQEIKKQGYKGSARTVRRYLSKLRPKSHREYKPYETLPAEQAQVDWGHFGTIVENGRRVKLYAFVFCLSWSRQRYAEFITSLNMAVFNACLHRAFQYVGGVPQTILFDNAKTVVAERVGTVVRFNPTLLELALRYGFTPNACWINDPESKGKVESNVKYLKNGFYYGREFKDLADLNHQLQTWLKEVANAKVHGTTGKIPQERLIEERNYLKPLPAIEAPLPVYETRKAGKTALISVDNNKYSVPAKLARKTVHFRRYEDRIEILDDEQVVAVHTLVKGKNQVVINDDHYPEHQKMKQRPKHPLQAEFEALAPVAEEYLQHLSQRREGHLREQMQKIISLKEEYSASEINAAMERALKFGAIGYAKLKSILQKQSQNPNILPTVGSNRANYKLDNLPYQVEVERRDTSYYEEVIQ
jgi:transposase